MNSKPTVYLAGPIGGISYGEATKWRTEARFHLGKWGIEAYSPMRTKEFLQNESNLTWLIDHWKDPMATSKGIMTRDYRDCTTADVVLVNLAGTTKASMGTVMEIAWCFQNRIPVVMVAEADNLHITHPMLVEAVNFRVDTMEEALRVVRSILLPNAEAV